MKFGSLFTGIGGLDLGLERAGWACRWQVEIDPFCRVVLAKHWPSVRRFVDVHFVSAAQLEPVEAIVGGFPCQDISPAGRRAGLTGHRSGLWREFRRIVGEVRPRFVIIENIFCGWKKYVPAVRVDLFRLGYSSLPIRVRASDFGAPHERARCLIVAEVAHSNGKRKLQPSRALEEIRRRFGHGGDEVPDAARERGVGRMAGSGEEASGWAHAETAGHSWWESEPDVGRVAHGVPARVDRLRGLGNAVVPVKAQWLGETINDAISSLEGRNT